MSIEVIIRKKILDCYDGLLNLSDYNIGNDGLRIVCEEIKYNSSFYHIVWLNHNQIVDIDPLSEVLVHNTSLKALYLTGNQIANVTPLFEALKYNTSLETLDLGGNMIADITPLSEALKYNRSLEVINLDCNQITSISSVNSFTGYNSTLEYFCIAGNYSIPPDEDQFYNIIEEMLSKNRHNAASKKK